MPDPIVPTTFSAKEFGAYSANWAAFLAKPDMAAFKTPDDEPPGSNLSLTYVSFALTTIGQLLSTVGADHINVRFLLDDKDKFTLTLYAVDARGNAMSGYYKPDEPLVSNNFIEAKKKPDFLVKVPAGMTKDWLTNWAAAHKDTSLPQAMFNPGSGPLIGYRIELRDFLEALLVAEDYNTQMLMVALCLRKYHTTDGNLASGAKDPNQVFGLVLRVYKKPKPVPASAEDSTARDSGTNSTDDKLPFLDLEQPFYDLSLPCPPN